MAQNIPLGEVITDSAKQQWQIGPSIGANGCSKIYCANKANDSTKKYDDYPYVAKLVSQYDF